MSRFLYALYITPRIPKDAAKKTQSAVEFAVNDRKMKALVAELQGHMKNASIAAMRQVDDIYRQTIRKTQAAMATNLYTLSQAVDGATKDYLSAGLNCVKYSNGALVNIASYAEMALRTGNRRAGLQAEGNMRAELGEYLVRITQYGACSDTCLPYQGRVFFDDVYAGGNPKNNTGGYPLLSTAIAGGLFHPNCRHKSHTYYEGISRDVQIMDTGATRENSKLEEKQRYNERQIRKWKRLEAGTLDEEQKSKYKLKVFEWQKRQRDLIEAHPKVLRRDYDREQVRA